MHRGERDRVPDLRHVLNRLVEHEAAQRVDQRRLQRRPRVACPDHLDGDLFREADGDSPFGVSRDPDNPGNVMGDLGIVL